MSFFQTRTNYFKELCELHKIVAHNTPIDGGLRKSFHRINDEEELGAACINWGHFPCVVHLGYTMRPRDNEGNELNKTIINSLLFLSKQKEGDMADKIQEAYDEAYEIMSDFISWFKNELEENGTCGNFRNIDFSNMKADMYGPLNNNLYGWLLLFTDESYAPEFSFDKNKWNIQ